MDLPIGGQEHLPYVRKESVRSVDVLTETSATNAAQRSRAEAVRVQRGLWKAKGKRRSHGDPKGQRFDYLTMDDEDRYPRNPRTPPGVSVMCWDRPPTSWLTPGDDRAADLFAVPRQRAAFHLFDDKPR
jgi:hypothetical protein